MDMIPPELTQSYLDLERCARNLDAQLRRDEVLRWLLEHQFAMPAVDSLLAVLRRLERQKAELQQPLDVLDPR